MNKRILVVAPHPDDEIIGVGGTILKNISAGNEVYIAVATKGEAPLFNPDRVEITRSEARKCHEFIGIKKTFFIDFPSTTLDTIPKHKINKAILDIVNEVKPTEVYIPHQGDMHFDHGIVSEATMVAVRPKNESAPRAVYAYETLSETGWNIPSVTNEFIPTVYVDISEYIEAKLEIMSFYNSQLALFPAARSVEAIEALAKFRGAIVNKCAAEAFMLIREIK